MKQADFRLDTTVRDGVLEISARGRLILVHPMANRGTAFTIEEREALGLSGLLPSRVTTIEEQLRRTYAQYSRSPSPLSKFIYLAQLRDRNEVLFYRLLSEHLEEMLPIIYTPTIGEAIERFSHEYTGARGVFLSIDHPDLVEQSLRDFELDADDVDLVVVTDSEGILGIGDQGVGGFQIAVGKLSVYTAAAGIHPRRAIPVVLDVGTDNLGLLNSDLYLGERHARVRGERYDEFIELFVNTVNKLFPNALLHWEDFGAANAHRILNRYSDQISTFNDDIQGTAAVVLAAVLAAVRLTGTQLPQHRVLIYGAGTAGAGVADLIREAMGRMGLPADQAYQQFWAFNSKGLIVADNPGVRDFQLPYARSRAEMADWDVADPKRISLIEAVRHVRPTILIGTSAQHGAFTEEVVREMAKHCERPIIMPLSNPTSRCEAHPADILEWTDGLALIATGSPFGTIKHGEVYHTIAQANNALIFPGLGLGVSVVQAKRVSPGMIYAAADALAGLMNEYRPGASLLPSMADLRLVAATVAKAVAETAQTQGLARRPLTNPINDIYQHMWKPRYPKLEILPPRQP
ncbi:NAD-dependent malic enzyme [Propionicimonas sp.]|uniref:NAD-dependent malic enzyme n=1 Tax=Propionicimonas sp. TaxID=1955623 RepID=UPI00178D8137|nr:NAD-dependent malic enzyme [Propionicimonas sp.]MBU3976092.1 NAD-dependent malic enzyme [Actinomycetota bacterium]MBA3020905.1 NAD-dependent malic enzyme [Propionicimonas sp.]MBU3985282.1 NAD-dependent malic enzyme [Actinomycetota bacterium]MBU4008272.1 NAD-dependent malic enzyme [Actinomycetota bacterium]MBU4064514.1 NAD-dependent malic enzyme [Actinomycetota bacterium]